MSQNEHIAIIGGGVIGITTGILLNIHGFKTKIYSNHILDEIDPNKVYDLPPELSSVYAAASIIPHSVDHPKSKEILAMSQKFFHRLAFSANCGVRLQRHYELHEYKPDKPIYEKVVRDLKYLNEDGNDWKNNPSIPKRGDAQGVWGWYFNTFFAEGPVYLNRLYQLYRASGGVIVQEQFYSAEDFKKIPEEIIVNCTGSWAKELFPEDKQNTKFIRGHMMKIRIYEVPRDYDNQYFSYNYSPTKDIYHRLNNNEKSTADVYFYPRSDGWLFGGSRQEGSPEVGEEWGNKDEQHSTELYKKDSWKEGIPKPIWDLNRELILSITNPKVDITDPKYSSFSYVGYRFTRTPIRIEKDNNFSNKLLFHNYGHGGAGYTLSWGSAYEIFNLIQKSTNYKPKFINSEIRKNSDLALLSIIEDLMQEEYSKGNNNE